MAKWLLKYKRKAFAVCHDVGGIIESSDDGRLWITSDKQQAEAWNKEYKGKSKVVNVEIEW
jgi:hypothetical protein